MPIRRLLGSYGDYALAAVIGAVYLVEVAFEHDTAGGHTARAAAALAFAAALALRRRLPLLPLLVALIVIELNHTVLKGLAEGGAFLFGIVIAIYSAGRYAHGRLALACALAVLAAIPLAAFDPTDPSPPGFSDFAYFAMFLGGPFVAGRIVRYRREREHALLGHAAALELERDAKAHEAVAEERTRIARELHDVESLCHRLPPVASKVAW